MGQESHTMEDSAMPRIGIRDLKAGRSPRRKRRTNPVHRDAPRTAGRGDHPLFTEKSGAGTHARGGLGAVLRGE